MKAHALAVVCALVATLVASAGVAHERSVSHSVIQLEPLRGRVQLSVAVREVDRLLETASPPGDREAWLSRYLTQGLRIAVLGSVCQSESGSFRALAAELGRAAFEWRLQCSADTGRARIESRLFEEVAPHHLHFARVTNGGTAVEHVLTEGHRSVEIVTASTHDRPFSFVRLGVEHILTGYDHLAFLLVLLVFAKSFGELARVVTGFTLGHSATLALAALGFVHPSTPLVEAAIGISIAVVAVENIWALSSYQSLLLPAGTVLALGCAALVGATRSGPAAWALSGIALAVGCYFGLVRRSPRPGQLRFAIATGFGLVHGLGFAGVLAEHPLPTGRLVSSLAGFSAGVELGQLAVAAAAWGALQAFSAWRPQSRPLIVQIASAGVCGAGVFWTITRLS